MRTGLWGVYSKLLARVLVFGKHFGRKDRVPDRNNELRSGLSLDCGPQTDTPRRASTARNLADRQATTLSRMIPSMTQEDVGCTVLPTVETLQKLEISVLGPR